MAYVRTRYRVRGLSGSGQTAEQAVSIGTGIGAPVAATAIGSTAVMTGALGALAVPVVGAAIAGVAILAADLIKNSGCGPTCIQATQYANQAGALMTQNMNAYLALPTPRSQSAQSAALGTFDALWAKLQQMCGDPSLGDAGKRCITDRQAGACVWKASQGGWQQQSGKWTYVPWGPAGSGNVCWNWFVGMRDPIANDPYVVPDAQAATPSSSPVAALTSGGGNLGLWLALGAAAVVAAMVL